VEPQHSASKALPGDVSYAQHDFSTTCAQTSTNPTGKNFSRLVEGGVPRAWYSWDREMKHASMELGRKYLWSIRNS
jgi:hypothetical protein